MNEECMNENSILLFCYIYLLYYKLWNLCDLSKRRGLLHLIFWMPIFSPARVVTDINQPVILIVIRCLK